MITQCIILPQLSKKNNGFYTKKEKPRAEARGGKTTAQPRLRLTLVFWLTLSIIKVVV